MPREFPAFPGVESQSVHIDQAIALRFRLRDQFRMSVELYFNRS